MIEIKRAAEFIRKGGLVVFPTETVYGLGADAFNSEAVARVFSAKGRPGDNPLILHVASVESFKELAYNPPEYAFNLINAHWPGPLTLVARKKPSLPSWLGGHPSGKTETIGIRMPAHLIAKSLIEEAGCVIAAPSANKAGKPSPTTLAHVLEDFPELEGEFVSSGIMALDGGSAIVGIESTVVDITGDQPKILRPGGITAEKVYAFTRCQGDVSLDIPDVSPRSPGMKYKHYAPYAEMTVLSGTSENIAAYVLAQKGRVGVLVHEKTLVFLQNLIFKATSMKNGLARSENHECLYAFAATGETESKLIRYNMDSNIKVLSLGVDEKAIAKNLFSRLREFDKIGVDIIFAEGIPSNGLGVAIMDRMLKAAEGRIVHV